MLNRLHAVIAIALALEAPAFAQAAQRQATGPQPLPRANFIADMDAEFRKMDADKNGQLTKSEIEQFQTQQQAAQGRARNKALFGQLDKDKNGQLSQAEFARIATPAPVANAQPMIARMDGNRDSQISSAEYRTATLANFDRVDSDKDGIVTADELKAGGVKPR